MSRKYDIFRILVAVMVLVSMAVGIVSAAPVTQNINYQGKLTDAAGNPLTGTYSATFTLYNVSSGGTALATDTHTVQASKGLFNTQVTADPSFFDGRALWLGIKVGADAEMTPRQELRPVPYALSLRPGSWITSPDVSYALNLQNNWGGKALNVNTSGSGSYGVFSLTTGPDSIGFEAFTQGPNSHGVRGITKGENSQGVAGYTSGNVSPGVYAITYGLQSPGVAVSTMGNYSKGVDASTTGYMSWGLSAYTKGQYSPGVRADTEGQRSYGVEANTKGDHSYGVLTFTSGPFSDGVKTETRGDLSRGVNVLTKGNYSSGVLSETMEGYSYGVEAITHHDNSIGVEVVTEGYQSPGVRSTTKGNFSNAVNADTQLNNSYGVHVSTTGFGSKGVVIITSGQQAPAVDAFSSGSGSHAILGKAIGPASNGVVAFSSQSPAIWAQTYRPDNKYGLQTPNLIRALGYETGSSDVAEYMPVSLDVTPGTVLVIGEDGKLLPSSIAYDTGVAGIVSTAPGVFLGAKENGNPGEQLIAVAGRVPCKVDASNGPIHPRDLLTTSDNPGYAMKATNPQIGTVLGKAMGSLESGTGTIEVLVTLQ